MTTVEQLIPRRTSAKRKAHQLATTLRHERPDYAYLKEVFRQLRAELGIVVPRTPKRLPYVPSEELIRRYCETVWRTRKPGGVVLIIGGILSVLFGIVLIVSPGAGALAVVFLIGAYAVLFGVTLLMLSWRLRSHAQRLPADGQTSGRAATA